MASEPTQDQLSAYLDDELDVAERSQLDAHLATCSSCRSRLEGMQQTVNALRALPMETPPRAFTVPAQRRQSVTRNWAPVGWLGGAAAALLVVAFGISQFHGFPGGASTASSTNISAGRAAAPLYQAQPGPVQPDQADAPAALATAAAQQVTVAEPGQTSRSLTVSTDSRSYAVGGIITIHVSVQGLSATEASSARMVVSRDGYAVRLAPPSSQAGFPMAFGAGYRIADLRLPAPQSGSYSLQVTVDLADGSTLVAQLPIAITP